MRSARRVLALTLAAAAMVAPAWSAGAAQPRTSLPDIEDEVMCPVCGTLLELSDSPQADRERVFIRKLIAEGRSKQQIEDALVAEYGAAALASPKGSGFNLTAYLVPIVALFFGAAAVTIGVRRWRRSGAGEPSEAAAPQGDDAERLESDLARYDL